MSKTKDQLPHLARAFLLALFASTSSDAQATKDVQKLPETPPARSIEDLNYLGGDAAMPTFADSIIPIGSGYRQAVFAKGMAFRVISQVQYVQNKLDAPVSADEQVYVGQRPFESAMVQPILTSDLRQLHLRGAQLYIGALWNGVSWNPSGPKSLQLWDLYFFKTFDEKRIELKAGYISANLDFIGLFVGGSFMTVPQSLNPYARYCEARLYKEAPLRNRPADLLSVVASRTNYSSYFTNHLAAEGKAVWRSGTTLKGSYSMRATPGNYVSLGLTYVYGPAITPRLPNALKFTASWTAYF